MRYNFIYKPYNVLSACTHSDVATFQSESYVETEPGAIKGEGRTDRSPNIPFRTRDAYVILPYSRRPRYPSVLQTPNLSITLEYQRSTSSLKFPSHGNKG
uniref:Ovule protein n=1 Tax=Heterorhabditis bacteriophora TaxID=37862 RepID=A0A1I7WZI3_HETBA